jgi:hypothetical protein
VAHHQGVYLDLDADQAREALLGSLWRDAIDVWRDIDAMRRLPAARRLLDAGSDPADLSVALRAAALDAVFAALARVDAGSDAGTGTDRYRTSAAGPDQGWCLVRTGPDGSPTTEPVGPLHAELLTLDPSGCAGVDLRR